VATRAGDTTTCGRTQVAEFTDLKQWHREYYIFNEILRIRMFKIYRIWKAFRVWRKCVRVDKFSTAVRTLENGLFILDEVLSPSLRDIRAQACALLDGQAAATSAGAEAGKLRLHSLVELKVYRLPDFVEAQVTDRPASKTRFSGPCGMASPHSTTLSGRACVRAQEAQASEAVERLRAFHSSTLDSAERACHAALEKLQRYLDTAGLVSVPPRSAR
jgi:hypothetical protein